MNQKVFSLVSIAVLFSFSLIAQSASISGIVKNEDGLVDYAAVVLNDEKVMYTNKEGNFSFENLNLGQYTLKVNFVGYLPLSTTVDINQIDQKVELSCQLESDMHLFDEVVVTGTKTFKRKTKSAVIVNVVDGATLENVQACNLSEGLKFQPGLRVETDCQTCNYTQLRMNGLEGGYSQILINGRPIFSPLTGLYGLEQVPVNMIEKIEVIRGGGSSLYGSSAIGGTVNVITKIPNKNGFSINTNYQNINARAKDFIFNANSTIVDPQGKSGITMFLNRRERQAYDHNEDNFSEIPEIMNTSIGFSSFLLPTKRQKIELNVSHLNEYRYGGEMIDGPAHLAAQSEERTHNVWMASLDYQINFANKKSSLITYLAFQNTLRDHYTGISPDIEDVNEYSDHLASPPYGNSLTNTLQGGLQLNYELLNFLGGTNVFTFGSEYLIDDTFDEISSYRYLIDQVTKDLGIFAQSDWEILPSLNLLSGIRIDKHNLVDRIVASPRISLLYKHGMNLQLRASYGTGFRAPQAFDTDLHIAFAGGGISRVRLADNLIEETSESYTVSINYDKPSEKWVAGFTLEGFYTRLNNAFALISIGEDNFGEVFEKRNGQGALVRGLTIETRANYAKKIQLETGLTIQKSQFENEVQYINEVPGTKDFIRTPNVYGFTNLSINPKSRFSANINYVFTGSMIIPHFAGATNQETDELFTSKGFHDISSKLAYLFPLNSNTNLEFYAGVKNIINSYQASFDVGKNRDSNFVYGPAQPRTIFVGLKWSL